MITCLHCFSGMESALPIDDDDDNDDDDDDIYSSWVSTRWQRSVELYNNRKEIAVYKRRTIPKTIEKHSTQNRKQ